VNVLVIPEDFTRDQYVLKPIIQAIMETIGKPRANVSVCNNPRLRGLSQALSWSQLERILDQYRGMVDLFLLCVDRDGDGARRARLDYLEQQASQVLASGRAFLAENAWQEIEVWALAGHDLPPEWKWDEIRAEPHPKERYFAPFVRQRGLQNTLGQGRKTLALEAARRYDRVRQRCPEDVAALEERIRAWSEDRP
jgi:hypothetical protein